VSGSSGKRQSVSLADVAAAAGTSTAVVSYVLNDGPRPVAAATRLRVLNEIERLGYRPNRIARALRSSRSNTLGLLIPDITNAFFADLTHTFETVAFQKGYLSFVGNASFDPVREGSYLQAFVDLHVDGIAVIDLDTGDSNSEALAEIQVPVVFIHHKAEGLPGDIVRFDEEAAGQRLAEVMSTQHVQHVVVIAGPSGPGPSGIRTEHFERAMSLSELPGSFHRIEVPYDRIDASRAFGEFLDVNPDLSNIGVYSPSYEQALGVLHACRLSERAVPDDIVVLGGGGTTAGRYASPAISSIDVPIDEMAVTALDLLLARINGESGPNISKTLAISYTDRGTTRPAQNRR
jgi:LacI family transcriptional regulator